jgi:small subunit ribosomal protein S21
MRGVFRSLHHGCATDWQGAHCRQSWKEHFLQVFVRDNDIDQALRVLKKKMQREGIFRELKARRSYEKPSKKRVREKSDAVRRRRKFDRKKAQREGLLPQSKGSGR